MSVHSKTEVMYRHLTPFVSYWKSRTVRKELFILHVSIETRHVPTPILLVIDSIGIAVLWYWLVLILISIDSQYPSIPIPRIAIPSNTNTNQYRNTINTNTINTNTQDRYWLVLICPACAQKLDILIPTNTSLEYWYWVLLLNRY